MSAFSQRLASLREQAGYSKTKMANKVGVALSTYANWEYGYNEPDMNMLCKIATSLNTSIDYLTGKVDNPNPDSNHVTESDLDEMLDNAKSFDGIPINDIDREVVRTFLKGRFSAK